jgi:thiamine pyrophosphokinase
LLQGKHEIAIDHAILGPTCGILPLGLATAQITTTGLEWDVGPSLANFLPFPLQVRVLTALGLCL